MAEDSALAGIDDGKSISINTALWWGAASNSQSLGRQMCCSLIEVLTRLRYKKGLRQCAKRQDLGESDYYDYYCYGGKTKSNPNL